MSLWWIPILGYPLIGAIFGWIRCQEVFCIPGAIWVALVMYAIGWPWFILRELVTGDPGDGL